MTERACAGCGTVLVKRKGELPAQLERRRYCSRACYLKYSAKPKARSKHSISGDAMKAKSWSIVLNHQKMARLAKLPRQHFESTEEALARGVPVTRCPPAYTAPSDHLPNGAPVRQATGRRRSAS